MIDPTITIEETVRTDWGAVVIGAGPAGSVTAHGLAARGVRTLLLDRKPLPRTKVCGCCLAPWGAHGLEAAGLGSALDGAVHTHSFRLRTKRSDAAMPKPGYRIIARDVLDARLAQLAAHSGADLLWPASAAVGPDGAVRIRGAEAPIRAQHVIVADGLGGSALTDHSAFGWRTARRSLIGAGATLPPDALDLDAGEIRMHVGRNGYVGLVRLPGGAIDAAAALRPGSVRNAGGPAALASAIVGTALRAHKWWGTPTLSRVRDRIRHGNVLVVGDAAGYVEPFTGEGMSWAVAGARTAAELIARDEAQRWPSAHARLVGRHQRRCRALAHVLRSPALVESAVTVAAIPGVARLLAAPFGRPPRHAVT